MNTTPFAKVLTAADEAAQMRVQPERGLRRHFQLDRNRAIRAPVFLKLTQ